MKGLKIYAPLLLALLVILLGGGWWFLETIGEGERPAIQLGEDIRSLGKQKVLTLSFADRKTGLRTLRVAIAQDNKSQVLAAQSFPQKGTRQKNISLTITPPALHLHDGVATLTVTAVDYSLRKNETVLTRPLTIDLTPPQIYLLTPTNNINPGGSCIVAFRTSEATVTGGIQVNGTFIQGYPATIAGKPALIVYFGVPPDTKKEGLGIRAIARDSGGNETSLALPALIRKKKFRSDKMNLTDNFLTQKMPDFQTSLPALSGKSPLEVFTYVNGTMRNENEAKILEMCRKSEPQQLWEGTFIRMKNASPMAMFGDKRTYVYGKQVVGESTHFGVDLASLANAPVEAINHGIVKYTGNIGIYGNMVLLDHGLGIFSVYGHLSAINAKTGQRVAKGEVIGNTGMTGLAGGDHLHLGMVVGGRFVNPIEWWDEHWIRDNVTKKLGNGL